MFLINSLVKINIFQKWLNFFCCHKMIVKKCLRNKLSYKLNNKSLWRIYFIAKKHDNPATF